MFPTQWCRRMTSSRTHVNSNCNVTTSKSGKPHEWHYSASILLFTKFCIGIRWIVRYCFVARRLTRFCCLNVLWILAQKLFVKSLLWHHYFHFPAQLRDDLFDVRMFVAPLYCDLILHLDVSFKCLQCFWSSYCHQVVNVRAHVHSHCSLSPFPSHTSVWS